MVLGIGDVEGSVGGDDAAVRTIQGGLDRETAVAGETLRANAGDGRNNTGLAVDLANRMILGIDDVDVAEPITTDSLGTVECRPPRVAAVAGIS